MDLVYWIKFFQLFSKLFITIHVEFSFLQYPFSYVTFLFTGNLHSGAPQKTKNSGVNLHTCINATSINASIINASNINASIINAFKHKCFKHKCNLSIYAEHIIGTITWNNISDFISTLVLPVFLFLLLLLNLPWNIAHLIRQISEYSVRRSIISWNQILYTNQRLMMDKNVKKPD